MTKSRIKGFEEMIMSGDSNKSQLALEQLPGYIERLTAQLPFVREETQRIGIEKALIKAGNLEELARAKLGVLRIS